MLGPCEDAVFQVPAVPWGSQKWSPVIIREALTRVRALNMWAKDPSEVHISLCGTHSASSRSRGVCKSLHSEGDGVRKACREAVEGHQGGRIVLQGWNEGFVRTLGEGERKFVWGMLKATPRRI